MTSEHRARLEQVRRDVEAVNAAKACGCGPDEPCALHRDLGDLPDWESRARAAEERVGQLEAALRRHVGSFPEKGVNICGGCLEYSPCPDAGLLSSEEKP